LARARPSDENGRLAKVVGHLVTTIPVSLLTPFWFDL